MDAAPFVMRSLVPAHLLLGGQQHARYADGVEGERQQLLCRRNELISAKNVGKQIRHVYLNHAMRSMGIFKMCDASLYLWWTLSTEYLLFVRIRY